MDAKRLGTFIAEHRKELGLTQALLAEQLHVTDKAISRWERGIGLPDISNIEALADALDVSLLELMQAQRKKRDDDNISTKKAEELLLDTIQLSKGPNKFTKSIGCMVLAIFGVIASVYVWIITGACRLWHLAEKHLLDLENFASIAISAEACLSEASSLGALINKRRSKMHQISCF